VNVSPAFEILEAFIEKTGWPRPRFHRLLEAFREDCWISGLRNHSNWKASDIEALAIIGENWRGLRDELVRCHDGGHFSSPHESEAHGTSSGWTLLPFFMGRTLYEDNLADCPLIAECLANLRNEVPLASMWASMMSAGTELSLHQHGENSRLRTHFVMSAGTDTALEIEEHVLPFVEGEAVVFEPCLEHRAWNRDAEGRGRLVLSIDFWHPLLSLHEVAALQFIERSLRT
jgi:hypothetical protein